MGLGRGKARIYALAGENDDPKAAEAVIKVAVDSYLRRPSVKPVAVEMIGRMMNETAVRRLKPAHAFRFDASVFFLFGDYAAWLISGKATILLFADGQLIRQSPDQIYQSVGLDLKYTTPADPAFKLPEHFQDKIALFMCSGVLPQDLDLEAITAALQGASSPQAWLDAVMPAICAAAQQTPEDPDAPLMDDRSAMAVFLPPRKPLVSFGRR